MNYALHAALACVLEEGLEARFARHRKNHLALRAGLEAMGLNYIPERSLTSLNAIAIPEGIPDTKIRSRLLEEFGIEIGGGLGPFNGKAWRIGLMGASSSRRNVTAVLASLESLLGEEGVSVSKGAALAAASKSYGA
jgi:alanine-glyoxylate transaminase/serine-glyoxylate transaminase/serine-pyruvate transaminase